MQEREKIFVPLKFSSTVNFTSIKKILLVDSDVQNYEIFVDSVNSHTLPIVYSQHSNRDELKEYLKVLKVERLAFVFNNALIKKKQFMNDELFFTEGDITGQQELSANCQFVIDLISNLEAKYVDFLVCNSLQEENWKKYYDLMKTKTGATIGASENETGNIKYGGDWIMENTRENVQEIYWTDKIENYTQTLVTSTISTNTTITQSDVNSYTWPVTISNGATVTFGENLIFSSDNRYFIIGSNGITVDGNGNTATLYGNFYYDGLIQNGMASSYGKSNITVYNIGVVTSGSVNLNENTGWVCRPYFAKGSNNNVVYNCYSTGSISTNDAGGICGGGAGGSGGSCIVYNCYSSGNTNYNGGGICGKDAGDSGSCIVYNCYSTGGIGYFAGGICGDGAGRNGGFCIVYNCYSTGNIGYWGGGICGANAGISSGSCIVYNCNSTGNIGNSAGGICGAGGSCIVYNCYSIGSIGDNAGGICGVNAGADDRFCVAYNCYSTGNIGDGAGGIHGTNAGNNGSYIIYNCKYKYKIGSIVGINSSSATTITTPYTKNGYTISFPDTSTNNLSYTSITNDELKNLLNAPKTITITENFTNILVVTINAQSPFLTATILNNTVNNSWYATGNPDQNPPNSANRPVLTSYPTGATVIFGPDNPSIVGTVNINITYKNIPATHQHVNYVVNLPPIWQETNAKLYYNDIDNNYLDILSNIHGVVNINKYGYTSDNTIKIAVTGIQDYEYTDIVPYIEGLSKYYGSTGNVGFNSGNLNASGNTGPNIKFKFGRVGYNVNWSVE
jgi:hypothetical protein